MITLISSSSLLLLLLSSFLIRRRNNFSALIICSRSRALRRLHSVGGGAPVNFWSAAAQNSAVAARRSAQFSNVAYLFQKIFSTELLLYRYACSTTFFSALWPQIRKKYHYEN